MTPGQIGAAVTAGTAIALAADFGPLPEPLALLGLAIVIVGTAAGGADGTLPRSLG